MPEAPPPPLPEISEQAAEASLRILYADIRCVTGLPIVNLIYRHLATREDALAWAWSALRPHFVSGAVAELANKLRAGMPSLVEGLRGGLAEQTGKRLDTTGALDVVRVYNEANALNLVAITALLQAGRGVSAPPAHDALSYLTKATLPGLPPLPELQSLGAETTARILRLNAIADEPDPVIVASLYRHLALWPEVLASVESLLNPRPQRTFLMSARQATVTAVRALLEEQPLGMPPPISPFTRHFMPMVERFATVTISKMVPIGSVLEQAWQPHSQIN